MSRPDRSSAAPSTPAPRFATGWAALWYALATMALAYPALSGQFLVNPHSDQFIAGFAFRDFAVQMLRAGQGIPHWNPYMYGGLPYVAAMHGDIFYPTQLLRVLVGTDVGMTWGFIIHTFLAGFLTYRFLRVWGLGFTASLVGGMSYLLCGPIASYASPGHDGKLFVSALLPLSLWMLVRGMRDGRDWAWGALALVIGLAVLAPHPQLVQYHLLVAGAFALFLAFGRDAHGVSLDRRTAVRRLSFALGAVLLGMAMGAVQFAPLREYLPFSPRSAGQGYDFATAYSFPVVELFNMYLPQFTGILDKYYGPNTIHFHSEYIGGAVLLLASLALGGAERHAFRRFWVGTLVVALLWMLGGETPFFRLVYELVPGTKFFRAPSTIIYVFAFAMSILAALGTERVLEHTASRRVTMDWIAFGGGVAVLASAGLIGNMTNGMVNDFAQSIAAQNGYDPGVVPQIAEQVRSGNHGQLLIGAWRSFLFIALAGLAILGYLGGRLDRRVVGIALPLIVGADLWSIGRKYWLFTPPARVQFASDPVIAFLKAQQEPGRVLVKALSSEGISPADPYFGRDSEGKGTGFMVHGIRSITGYHGNELGRYDQLIMDSTGRRLAASIMSPPFWRHENARYLYTNVVVPDSQLKLLAGPVKNSTGSTAYLYRLPGNNPYAWVASAMTKAPDADVRGAVLDPRFDPLRIAAFADDAAISPAPIAAPPAPSAITASTSRYAPGRASIALSAPATAGSALVVSENYFPGWTATIDGRVQPVYRADFNLIGVPLPAGARQVELSFRDAAVDTGAAISLAAIGLAVMALAAGALSERRSRA